MKIKEAKYHSCPTCSATKQVRGDEYGCDGCDVCKKPIDRGGKQRQYLQATVFKHGAETGHLEFCSWKCALRGLKKVKTDYFIGLPSLHYDERQKGIRAKDFFDAVKAFK